MIPGLYPPGPWDDEPDLAEWIDEATGYTCAIFRHPEIGNLNGYVRLAEDHPLIGVPYSVPVPPEFTQEIEGVMKQPVGKRGIIDVFLAAFGDERQVGLLFDVHGSITFSGRHSYLSPGWWYGFDCGHGLDLLPGMIFLRKQIHRKHPEIGEIPERMEVYRDWAYVRAECASLAGQLASLAEIFKLMNAEARAATAAALKRAAEAPRPRLDLDDDDERALRIDREDND